jgi:L-threonylcarbamoyladenylate synthase
MNTDLIEIDQDKPSPQAIAKAAAVIRAGGIVAIPTDALYTLVADPFNLHAVGRVFQAKGRETSRSLPLLVSDVIMAEELASDLTKQFFLLARRFWPGPLTIIVPAASKLPLKVTGNTGRLGLRQAKSATANALLEWLGQPLISTSANISGQPTCRAGIEVFGSMDGRLDLVLDGGTAIGGASTTVDITGVNWRVIREGTLTERDLADCLDGV